MSKAKQNMLKNIALMTVVAATSLTVNTGCSTIGASVNGSQPLGVSLGDRTVSQRMRDVSIANNAEANIYKANAGFNKNAHIDVESFHDVVLITGQVSQPQLKALATEVAYSIPEVRLVHNELTIQPPVSYRRGFADASIHASVRKNLLLAQGLKGSRIKIVVENAVVYVMGILKPNEIAVALRVIGQTPGIARIVSLVEPVDKAYQRISKDIEKRKAQTSVEVQNQYTVQPVTKENPLITE